MEHLKRQNHGVTVLDAKGLYGNVKILFTVIPRQKIDSVVAVIRKINPQAFYTIEDVRFVNEQHLYSRSSTKLYEKPFFFRKLFRKGK